MNVTPSSSRRDAVVERVFTGVGWSAVHCPPAAMTVPDSAATGTVMRPAALERFARQAGFSSVTVLEIEHDCWRFYRLDR